MCLTVGVPFIAVGNHSDDYQLTIIQALSWQCVLDAAAQQVEATWDSGFDSWPTLTAKGGGIYLWSQLLQEAEAGGSQVHGQREQHSEPCL